MRQFVAMWPRIDMVRMSDSPISALARTTTQFPRTSVLALAAPAPRGLGRCEPCARTSMPPGDEMCAPCHGSSKAKSKEMPGHFRTEVGFLRLWTAGCVSALDGLAPPNGRRDWLCVPFGWVTVDYLDPAWTGAVGGEAAVSFWLPRPSGQSDAAAALRRLQDVKSLPVFAPSRHGRRICHNWPAQPP